MKEVSVEEILNQFSLIVPEIQREYVWGLNQYGIFEAFLKDIKDGFQSEGEVPAEVKSLQATIENPLLDDAIKQNLISLLEGMKKPVVAMNIGFLYSYKPGYYIGNDREEDLYLIDGQQRFTTLFLTLFYFSLKEDRKEDFLLLFKFDAAKEKIAFDYRVRSITHQFIIELISKCETLEDLLNIREKGWFLANYSMDTTVKSITGHDENSGVFNLLNNFFKEDTNKYFNFIKSDIKFWHFKTEETSQGEELYITMNSRGQQLADNETIRARLFDDDEVRANSIYWSEQWELWQDFFWKHRNKKKEGISADEGFNEFLRWVQLLKMWELNFKNGSNSPELAKQFEKVSQWESGSQLNINYLELHDIELTFKALVFLYKTLDITKFKDLYPLSYKEKSLPPDWISTTGEPLGLINMFQLLPLLLYCKKSIEEENEKLDEHTIYRLTRILKTLSSDKVIGKAVRNQITNVLFFIDQISPSQDITMVLNVPNISKTILNDELRAKLELISKTKERNRLEDAIWFAEDIRYNDGEILHLIKLTDSINPKGEQFDLALFEKVINACKELIANAVDVFGNLLHTDCYNDSFDRIEYRQNWYQRNGFLNLVHERILSPEKTIAMFLMIQQKKFISLYSSPEEIFEELYSGKQLYCYYILSTNNILALKPSWDWNGQFNFGKFNSFGYHTSLFKEGKIFQFYKTAFRENENKVLEIHKLSYKTAVELLHAWGSN